MYTKQTFYCTVHGFFLKFHLLIFVGQYAFFASCERSTIAVVIGHIVTWYVKHIWALWTVVEVNNMKTCKGSKMEIRRETWRKTKNSYKSTVPLIYVNVSLYHSFPPIGFPLYHRITHFGKKQDSVELKIVCVL